jgi:hypothetical protein
MSSKLDRLDDYLGGIAIGVRFRANFGIEDQLGRIIDTILYSDDSFFNPKVFPGVAAELGEKSLLNTKSGDYLKIDNSNVVLQLHFKGDSAIFSRSNQADIVNAFKRQILNGVLKEFKIKQINRIGFVSNYLFPIETLSEGFVSKTIGGPLSGINDIVLRFSKRYPSQESLVRKGVLDYYNAIYTVIKKPSRNDIQMSVDYQKSFDPFLASSSDIEFDDFILKASSYNSETFLTWINATYLTA